MVCLPEDISKGMSMLLVKYKKMLFYNRTNASEGIYGNALCALYMSFQTLFECKLPL